MGVTLYGVQEKLLPSFRNFARDIRAPQPYIPVISECKGVFNIAIGLGQIAVCPYFKLIKAERLCDVHMEAGKSALKQGMLDLAPAIVITAVVVASITAQTWMQS
jgi:hypothetical protein